MKLDLSEIALNLGKRIAYHIDEPPIKDMDGGLNCISPIVGDAVFTNTGSHILVRGNFKTRVEIECSRCLRMYTTDLDLPIEEALPIEGHIPEVSEDDEDQEILDEEFDPLYVDNIYDLTELLRQSIIVAVPIKALCLEDCKGLCPHCGMNLNEGQCECPPETLNEAFAGLAALLEKDKEENSEE